MKRSVSIICSLVMVLQLLLGTVTVWAEGETEAEKYTAPESPAVTYNMNVDWKFKKASDSATYPLASAAESVAKDGKQFYEAGYDDSDWETVSVSHPINAEDSFDGNCYDAGESGLYRGFMFYRKHITIPQSDAGKKMFLEFEAVRQSVYLYVNGELVGYYEAGIAPIGFDISNYVVAGQDNLIAVATDNASDRGQADTTKVTHETKPGSAAGAANGIGYQWNTKDFNEVQGGLTGNVNLYAKGKVYQTLPLYNNLKTKGNYIYATDFNIRENKAIVNVEGEVRNETEDAVSGLTLEVNIVDFDGNLVSTFSGNADVAAANDAGDVFASVVPADAYDEEPAATNAETVDVTKITASATVEGLNFWSPDSPNLYDVYTVLKNGDTVIDVQKTTTGFRKVEYDINNGGLLINEKPVWLTGYAQRSTNEWAVIGVANDWLQDLDMQWVKESNSNFIRWMHVAPKPAQIRSGDKYGVVSAAPAGDKEGDTTGRAWDQRVEAMRDTMIYFRNSPSVIFWEDGNNEITPEHLKEMTTLKAKLDPNGGRFAGCRTISSVDQIKEAEYAGTMLNRHAANAKTSMATAKKYMPIMETEYAREEAPRRVWDDFSPPDYDYRNMWLGAGAAKKDGYDVHDLTSEDFAIVDVNAYNEFYSDRVGGPSGNDYYSAAAIMVWSDSNMHNRNTATENCRTSGKVDPVRIKKEAFYALQAAQSKTPKIHIIGHWNYPQLSEDTYNYPIKEFNGTYWEETGETGKRDPKHKTVYVIGSAGIAKMELYVNNVLKGTSTKATNNFVYSFPDIDVTESGTVKAVAYNAQEQVVDEDEISTVGEAVTVKLTPVTGPDGLIADGSDIAYFDVAVVDKDGNTCPLAYNKLNMSLAGKGVLLGGYNSGVGNKITTNNKDFCYAECGTNRIFVRSTREAGDITLSVSLDGQSPVSATITSAALELDGGLTTQMQRSFAQGEVPQPIVQEVPALKALSSGFEADFNEETGNTEVVVETAKPVDTYKLTINGTEVTGYTKTPYRESGASTGVVCDAIKTLDALKAIGANITYTIQTEGDLPQPSTIYDGKLPIVSITGGLRSTYTQLDIMNGSTTLIENRTGKNLMNAQNEYVDGEMIVDIAGVLGYIDGVTYQLDTDNKIAKVTYTAPSAQTSVNDIKLYADDNTDADKCVKITATYDDNGILTDVTTEIVSKSEAFPVSEKNRKVMYWESLESMVPVTAEEPAASPVPWGPQDITKYDTQVNLHTCESSSLTSLSGNNSDGNAMVPATIEAGAPDGTNYIKTGSCGNNKYSEYCFQEEFSFGENTKSDIMFALDVRFDADGSGFCAESDSDSKVAGAVKNNGGKLAVQKSGSDYNTTSVVLDTTAWYHIKMVGRYSASDAAVDMYVWKYNSDGTKEYITKVANIALRNLSASNNNGASHLNILPNTSVDNLSVYKLGADALSINSSDNTIKAGETMLFTYGATRGNEHITSPAVTWAVYDKDNTEVLDDDQITISDSGLLVIGSNAKTQVIAVRVIANAGAENEIYAVKKMKVEAVDTSSDTYDTLTLSSDNTTVRVGQNVQITAAATLKGEAVTPGEGDLKYVICNQANLRENGNKGISITDDGVLSVTADVVPQTITVKGINKSGSVWGACQVQVLPVNMNYGNEDLYSDTFASSNACEEYGLTGLTLAEGSWDGSGYYNVTAATDFAGFSDNTTADVIYSADMQFANDGAGWTVFNANKGKLGLQLSLSGTTLNAIGASNKTVGTLSGIDKNAWYNVQIMCATGKKGDSYAVCSVYKYNNGKKVHPASGEENVPYYLTVDLRNLSEDSANHVNINAGTNVDNILNMYVAPDELKLTVDAKEILAGGSAQASTTASRKGVAFPKLNSNLIKYAIYDSENRYPLESDKITIDPSGKISVDAMADPQDVYVRVSSTSGGMSDSVKITIKSSDIFEITKAGFNDDFSVLKRLTVTKNFYYDDDVTFVAATYDENGVMTSIATKKLFGDSLNVGEGNHVQMNMTMPEAFDKVNDRLNAFIVTKLSTSKKTEGADITITPGTTTTVLSGLPEFDASAKVVVLVLKSGADEENVSDADIAYFVQMSAADIVENSITIPGVMTAGMTAKVVGTVGGVHTIAVSTQSN